MARDRLIESDIDPTGVGWIRLCRPEKRNAFNPAMVEEFLEALDALASGGVEVAVLVGEGPIFSSGGDLGELDNGTAAAFSKMLVALQTTPVFLVATVTGGAVGGALALLSLCPILLATPEAWFSVPEVTYGHFPGGVMAYLYLIIGPRHSWRLGLFGERIGALEAHSLGLVTEIVPEASFDDRLRSVLEFVSGNRSAMRRARAAWQSQFTSDDFKERRAVFMSTAAVAEESGPSKMGAVWTARRLRGAQDGFDVGGRE